jgi:hypothetical protein
MANGAAIIVCARVKVDSVDWVRSFDVMGRRKKPVEGLILDLTRVIEGVPFTLEELIVVEEIKPKAQVIRVEGACVSCGVIRMFDISRNRICFMCRTLRDVSSEVVEYIRNAYKGPCSLCGRGDTKYHYDHINMFDKKASIIEMIHEPLDVIAAEIAKCQLVCIPCHSEITAEEVRMGYISKKIKLMMAKHKGEDIEELRTQLAAQYAIDIAEVYARLRGGGAAREISGSSNGGSLRG